MNHPQNTSALNRTHGLCFLTPMTAAPSTSKNASDHRVFAGKSLGHLLHMSRFNSSSLRPPPSPPSGQEASRSAPPPSRSARLARGFHGGRNGPGGGWGPAFVRLSDMGSNLRVPGTIIYGHGHLFHAHQGRVLTQTHVCSILEPGCWNCLLGSSKFGGKAPKPLPDLETISDSNGHALAHVANPIS